MIATLKKDAVRTESHSYQGDEEMANLLGVLSHDIRASFVSVSANLKLLTSGYYGKMDDRVRNQLIELNTRILGFGHVFEESLRKALSSETNPEKDHETLDLKKDVVDPVLEELYHEIKESHIQIEDRMNQGETRRVRLKASRIWLKAVFRNLLRNAIKYGGMGCTIAFGFEKRGSLCQMNVYNSGDPIPEGWRDRLFSKFTRPESQGNRSSDGMGLGLYLIKKVLQRHGGEIWYEPNENGSNFVFTVPVEAC